MNQEDFEKTVGQFEEIEDARDQLWERARVLIESDFEVEAYVLILATWNFAHFRYEMKTFDLHKFQEVISKVNPIFERLKDRRFEDNDFETAPLKSDIEFIYDQFKSIAKQTGASKLMALKNPNLFIMWDTEIRKMYRIPGTEAADYVHFLIKMKEHFKDIVWTGRERSLAKTIDEYNYVKADEIRKRKKDLPPRARIST